MKFSSLNTLKLHFGPKKNVQKRDEMFAPVRDWFVLLAVGGCVLLGLIGYGLWVYWSVEHATYPDKTDSATSLYLSHLETTLDDAQKERAIFEALKTQAPAVPDPSL